MDADAETLEIGVSSAKVASLVAVTQVVVTAISGVMLIVLARLLQPASYGVYTLAYSVSLFFSAFGLAGIGHYLNKYVPLWIARKKRGELEKDLGVSFASLAGICIIAIIAGAALSGFISAYVFHSANYTSLIWIALLTILFMQLMYLCYNALIGFRDGIGAAATYTAGTLLIAIFSIGFVIRGYGVNGAFYGIIAGASAGVAIGIFYISKHSRIDVFPGDFAERARKVAGFSFPVASAFLVSVAMNNLSVLVLGAFSSAALIGSFGVAYRIGTIVNAAIFFVGSVLVQMFSSILESRKSKDKIGRLYNYSIYFGALLAVPAAAYLIALAPAFVASLFPGYRSSLLYTPAVTLSILVGIIGIYASSLVISIGKVKKVLKYAILTGAAQLILLLVLVPIMHAYGVILGVYLGGNLLSNYLYMRYMDRELKIKTNMAKVYKIIIAGVFLAAVLYPINFLPFSQTAQLVIGGIVMLIVYPALLGLTKSIGKGELRLLQKVRESSPAFRIFMPPVVSYISLFIRQ